MLYICMPHAHYIRITSFTSVKCCLLPFTETCMRACGGHILISALTSRVSKVVSVMRAVTALYI